ncbi:MAG TPA: ABC transporter permease subunit [Gaiellaceae bacterium]|nr:ABC transporter permease subunit [Gaiellaceae bacterium]
MSAASSIARRAFADGRTRTLSFALLFAGVAVANAVGFRHTFPTLADRLSFARNFGHDKSVRLFYGAPHDLLTAGGYTAWRAGGSLSIFAAMWGLLAAIRAFRTEEDAGRQELVLSGAVTRTAAFLAALAAIGAGALVLWLALFLGLVGARLPAAGSAFLALATVAVIPAFVGVGALASQIAASRRVALELGSAALGGAFLLRVIADTSSLGWLRWTTPLGWTEELRAFAGQRPSVLLLPAAAGALLLLISALISGRRDVGTGLLHTKDSAEPSSRLLGSPTRYALRSERISLAGWLFGAGFFAFILGVIASSISSTTLPASVQQRLEKLGSVAITTPAGYLGFTFLFFIFVISLFCCSQIAAARREEAEQQLETLLALPVSRRRWFGGRLVLAAAGATVISLVTGVLAWAGSASQGADVSLAQMLGAGANCLPAALLFLGIGALAFAVLPRASAGIAYGVASLAFLWQLFGSVLGAPTWLLDLSPFRHIGLVPAQPFRAGEAAAMLAIAALLTLVSLRLFDRRDLLGA